MFTLNQPFRCRAIMAKERSGRNPQFRFRTGTWSTRNLTNGQPGNSHKLIRCLQLSAEFSQQLNPFVRSKYDELWQAVRDDPAV